MININNKLKTLNSNIKTLNNLFYNIKNRNPETSEYNVISPKNYHKIFADFIYDYVNDKQQLFSKKDLKHIAYNDDMKCMELGDINSKEVAYATLQSFRCLHHDDILYLELFMNDNKLNSIFGFDLNEIVVAKLLIANLLASKKYVINSRKLKKRFQPVFSFFSVNIEELNNMSSEEIFYKLEDFPIIKIGELYYFTTLHNFQENIFRILFYKLKDSEYFKRKKGKVLEECVYDVIQFYTPNVKLYRNIKHNGNETDILVETDSEYFVFEVKSILVYDDYRRNINSNKIKNNIDDLINKPYNQCKKFEKALLHKCDFRDADGNVLNFSRDKSVYKIAVSVERHYGIDLYKDDNFLTVSFSDFLGMFQITYEKLYGVPNFSSFYEGIKELIYINNVPDMLKGYIFINAMPKTHIQLLKENSEFIVMDIKLHVIEQYDKFVHFHFLCPDKSCLDNMPQDIPFYVQKYMDKYDDFMKNYE